MPGLVYLLELVVGMALGSALVKWRIEIEGGKTFIEWFTNHHPSWQFDELVFSLLAGIAFVEFAGLLIESARRKGPPHWGVGRCVWAVVGISTLLGNAWYGLWEILHRRVSEGSFPKVSWCLGCLVDRPWVYVEDIAWVPVGLFIAVWLGRWRGDLRPDDREWAGRCFGVMMILSKMSADLYTLEYWSR